MALSGSLLYAYCLRTNNKNNKGRKSPSWESQQEFRRNKIIGKWERNTDTTFILFSNENNNERNTNLWNMRQKGIIAKLKSLCLLWCLRSSTVVNTTQ